MTGGDAVDAFFGWCSASWGVHDEHLCALDRGHLEQEDDVPVPFARRKSLQMHECDCGADIWEDDLQERNA